MVIALVGQVLGGGEGETRGNDTLDGRVVGKVEEEGSTRDRARLLEIVAGEVVVVVVRWW